MSALPPTPMPYPVVLLASRDEVFARSLETVLAPAGYAVLRAFTARSAREQARRTRPDAVVLATDLEDPSGLELCRMLRADAAVSASTPILLTEPGTATRQSRIDALRAGADQLWSQPMDTEEFALRLAVGVRAKRDADAARAGALVDERSSFWNQTGLLRCAEETLAQMGRARAALTIAVLEPVWPAARDDWDLGDRVATALRSAARHADSVGRLAAARFAVLAPRTGTANAALLGQRLLEGVRRVITAGAEALRVGLACLDDAAIAPPAPELLARAVAALEYGDQVGSEVDVRRWAPPA
ncbi:MAG TPA: response regulator [Gemmatimonadales bacterium]|nr:response regulator [Gemmatimonadales bacterium]